MKERVLLVNLPGRQDFFPIRQLRGRYPQWHTAALQRAAAKGREQDKKSLWRGELNKKHVSVRWSTAKGTEPQVEKGKRELKHMNTLFGINNFQKYGKLFSSKTCHSKRGPCEKFQHMKMELVEVFCCVIKWINKIFIHHVKSQVSTRLCVISDTWRCKHIFQVTNAKSSKLTKISSKFSWILSVHIFSIFFFVSDEASWQCWTSLFSAKFLPKLYSLLKLPAGEAKKTRSDQFLLCWFCVWLIDLCGQNWMNKLQCEIIVS